MLDKMSHEHGDNDGENEVDMDDINDHYGSIRDQQRYFVLG